MTTALDAAWKNWEDARVSTTKLATAGDSSNSFNLYNGDYSRATETIQDILISIGESADAQAATAYGRISSLISMVVIGMLIIGVICIVNCLKSTKVNTALIVDPINELQNIRWIPSEAS